MPLATTLADELLCRHPERAAAVLERTEPGEALAVLARPEPAVAAEVLRHASPGRARAALSAMPRPRAAALLDALELDTAARLARRLDEAASEEVLRQVAAPRARALRALLRFPERTAGALMDPEVLALPQDFRAREALARVREEPGQARYNLYVVDAEQRLVGALNLRELLLAAPDERLADRMVRDPLRILASADRAAVVSHPGWRVVHALPVVDEADRFLGALRYRTLRELEEELLRGRTPERDTAEALGDLFAVGAAGLLDALAPLAAGGARGR